MKTITSLLLAVTLLSSAALADGPQDKDHPHEDLTKTQLGTVHFPVSCAESVQEPFQRGVALLHSFWYEEAEKEFLDIAKNDPACAMAHWGVAMSLWHELWNQPDAKVLAHGLSEAKAAEKIRKKASPREGAYIAAVKKFYGGSKKRAFNERAKNYSAAMRNAYQSYPDDHEAAVFYALSLLAFEENMDHRKEAAAILEKLFAVEPDHPGVAHYLIHSYDTPSMAELGIRRRAAMHKSPPPLLTHSICLRISSRAWACGRTTSTRIWHPWRQPARLRQWEWEARAISFMLLIFLSMHTCRAGAKKRRPGSSRK